MKTCFHCNKVIDKSWLHLDNMPVIDDKGHSVKSTKHICGYSCYKRLSEKSQLPDNLWSHIVNKCDYDGLISPVRETIVKKEFEYLTNEEVDALSDTDKINYFDMESEQVNLDPVLTEIREEIDMEDRRTAYLELSSEDDY